MGVKTDLMLHFVCLGQQNRFVEWLDGRQDRQRDRHWQLKHQYSGRLQNGSRPRSDSSESSDVAASSRQRPTCKSHYERAPTNHRRGHILQRHPPTQAPSERQWKWQFRNPERREENVKASRDDEKRPTVYCGVWTVQEAWMDEGRVLLRRFLYDNAVVVASTAYLKERWPSLTREELQKGRAFELCERSKQKNVRITKTVTER